MKSIFRDDEIQLFFEKEGYVILPLLSPVEVGELKLLYESLQTNNEEAGLYASMDFSDREMCRMVREKIWAVVLPRLDVHLKDYRSFVAGFMAKEPGINGAVPVHQDWTFVEGEETGNYSATCWIALDDIYMDNGALGYIRGSHNLSRNVRPSPDPYTLSALAEHVSALFPYLQISEMKLGEVVIFDDRIFHGSPPNIREKVRLAAVLEVTHQDVGLVHYYLKPDGTKSTLLKYAVDEEFFLKYHNAELASKYEKGEFIEDYKLLEELPYNRSGFVQEKLLELVKEKGNEYNQVLCEHMTKMFGSGPGQEKTTVEIVEELPAAKVSERHFFQIYTPMNIMREIKGRIGW